MASIGEELIQRGRMQGRAEGKAEGKAEGILAVLEARGFKLTVEQRTRITSSKDLAELDRWLKLAVTASDVETLFRH